MAPHDVSILEMHYPGAGGAPMPATLYRPSGSGPFPAVVELAGGGWVNGGRLDNEAVNRDLAGRGMLVLAIEVARPPLAGYPQAIRDVNGAVRWFKDQVGSLGGDPARVGGLGWSSGGHQIVLNALRHAEPMYAGGSQAAAHDASLAFLIACWPVLDPLARYRMAQSRGMAQLVANHDAYWGSEASMAEGSPQAILTRGAAQATPPLLLLQGGRDDNVPASMTLAFAEAYCAAGGMAEVALFPGEPHSFVRKSPASAAARSVVDRIADFVQRVAATL